MQEIHSKPCYGCTLSERIFCSSDCLASAQSCANQFSRLRGVVETTFSHRIASHSPFESDWKRDWFVTVPQHYAVLRLRIKD